MRNNDLGLYFEEIVMKVVKQYCLDNNKVLLTNYEINKNMRFDAFAPNGIIDEIPSLIEISYSKSYDQLFSKIKRGTSFVINAVNKLGEKRLKIIFITLIKDKNILKVQREIKTINNIEIEIWDYNRTIDFLKQHIFELKILIDEGIINNEKILEEKKLNIDVISEKSEVNAKLLKKILKDSKISLVIGTGLSLEYGTPSWNELAKNLYDYISGKFINKEKAIQKIGGDNLCITQYVKQELNSVSNSRYTKVLKNELYRNYQRGNSYFGTTLMSTSDLISNEYVKKVITYNYDNHLENELDRRNIKYSLMVSKEDFIKNKLPIYHVHGFLPNTKTIDDEKSNNVVLTEDDYFSLYSNLNNWQVAIQLQTFKDDICLFVGNSITDYNEKRLLNETRQKFKHHYAIMFKDGLEIEDLSKITNYFFINYNVDIIWVNNKQEYNFLISYLNI